MLRTRPDVMRHYVGLAPLALAFERVLECRILHAQPFEQPVLDIGCGEGLFAHVLFDGQVDTGIDPNALELARARELGAYAELLECKGDNIPKPDASYRTILSNSVMEHIPDLQPVLREAFRLLAPGGRMYMTVPSDRFEQYTWISQALAALGLRGLQQRFRKFFNSFWAHYHYYTPQQWAQLVEEAGFEVAEIHTYAPKRTCMLNTALVPFSIPSLLTKKAINRWTLFPALRRVMLAPAMAFGNAVLRGGERCEDGGLVFISLRKPATP
jgi:SAM-dependent methyltransferase